MTSSVFSFIAAITTYMKYIATLDFETRPNYAYLRNLFRRGAYVEEDSPTSPYAKRVADENISSLKPSSMPYLRDRRPCRPINGEVRPINIQIYRCEGWHYVIVPERLSSRIINRLISQH